MSSPVTAYGRDRAPLVDVFVPGTPAAQGSKRHVGGGRMIESSKHLAPWRSTVALAVFTACAGPPALGAVEVDLEFVLPRPKSTPKRGATPAHTKRPDLDKLVRAVFDAVTEAGRVWVDDCQAVRLTTVKRTAEVGEVPGVTIRVYERSVVAA